MDYANEVRRSLCRQLTTLDGARHEVLHSDPAVLPGQRVILFSSLTTDAGTERIEAVSIEGQKRSVVIEHAITPVWSSTGHLTVRGGNL